MKRLLTLAAFCLSMAAAAQPTDGSVALMPEKPFAGRFPYLAMAIKHETTLESYPLKVYYGSFDGKSIVHGTQKGYIVIDQKVLDNNASSDSYLTWGLLSEAGRLHLLDGRKAAPTAYASSSSGFAYALEWAIVLALRDSSNCSMVKSFLNNIKFGGMGSSDTALRRACADFQKQQVYADAQELVRNCNAAPSRAASTAVPVKDTPSTVKPNPFVRVRKPVAAAPPARPVDSARVARAMEEIRKEENTFQNYTTYTSRKTPHETGDVDRMFLYFNIHTDGRKAITLAIRHNAYPSSVYLNIQNIIIKVDDKPYPLDAVMKMFGGVANQIAYNSTQHSTFKHTMMKTGQMYGIVKAAMEGENVEVRLQGGGRYIDFKVSNREKKAMKDVIELYEAMMGY